MVNTTSACRATAVVGVGCDAVNSDRLSGPVRAGERVDSAHGRQRDDQVQRDAGDVVLFLSAQSVDRRRRQLLSELVGVEQQ